MITDALERDRLRRPLGQSGLLLRLRAQHRETLSEPSAGRALRLEQRSQREQVVGQSLERGEPLAAHLEPRERPRELAAARRAARDQVAERPQLVLLTRR